MRRPGRAGFLQHCLTGVPEQGDSVHWHACFGNTCYHMGIIGIYLAELLQHLERIPEPVLVEVSIGQPFIGRAIVGIMLYCRLEVGFGAGDIAIGCSVETTAIFHGSRVTQDDQVINGSN